MKEYKRSIDKSIRELERERVKMQNQEKKLISDMRRHAKLNQMVRNNFKTLYLCANRKL